MKTRSYEEHIVEAMKDPEEARMYLEAALEDGPEVFLLALRHVAKAQGNMKKLADDAEISRRALYNILSEDGNPTLVSFLAVLEALNIKLKFAPKIEGHEAA
jgi:probable addiction module antidote protein